MWIFGLIGYTLRKLRFPLAPLVIARVLGPILEPAFRRSLIMTDGSFMIFLQRPIALGILIFDVVLLVWTSVSASQKKAIADFFKGLVGINAKQRQE
jgi:putative tricarboxylic transport membrane protein